MSNVGWDPAAGLWRRILVDGDGKLITKPEGVYLETLPTLGDGEQHRLILTVDGKLLVDDPTTQAKIDELLEIKGDGWSYETLKAIYDDIIGELLTIKWDISAAVYLQSKSVVAQETYVTGLFFKPDGTKMYVMGSTGDDVNEYDLNTPWNVTTAAYVQSHSIAGEESDPQQVFFRSDGIKMYIIGANGDEVNEYDLSTPWDVTTAVHLQLFDVSGQDTFPSGLFFKPDGTKMYIIGNQADNIHEYSLSTPWDISTATYIQLFNVTAKESYPLGIFFKPCGTVMYVIGRDLVNVNEYHLSTPWDISTAVYHQLFDVSGQEIRPQELFFNPSGTKMYVVGSANNTVYEYDVGTARLAELDAANIPADIDDLTTAVGAIPTTPELEADADTRYDAIIAAILAIPEGLTAAQVWAYATRRLTNLSDVRAAKIDNLDDTISSRTAITKKVLTVDFYSPANAGSYKECPNLSFNTDGVFFYMIMGHGRGGESIKVRVVDNNDIVIVPEAVSASQTMVKLLEGRVTARGFHLEATYTGIFRPEIDYEGSLVLRLI